MKKRLLILTIITVIIAAMPAGFVYAAGNAHGEEARSESMSAGSGDQPIEDMSVTQDPGAGGAEGWLSDHFGGTFPDMPWDKVVIGAAALLGLIVLIVIIKIISGLRQPRADAPRTRSKEDRKKDKGYIAKH